VTQRFTGGVSRPNNRNANVRRKMVNRVLIRNRSTRWHNTSCHYQIVRYDVDMLHDREPSHD